MSTRVRGLSIAASLLCGCTTVQSALAPAGVQAARIRGVWDVFLPVAVVVYVAVVVVYALAMRGHTRGDAAQDWEHLRPDAATEKRLGTRVATAIGLTVFTLFGLLLVSMTAGRAIASLTPRERMTVRVIAHQWWWEVQYSDAHPSHMVITANEIHIPVGRPVDIQLESRDVIHSFWVPALHGKRDAIPGHIGHLIIEADHPGVFRGQCAEFCGYQHANMALFVVAESPARYEAWLAQQNGAARVAATPDEQRGQRVFLSHACVMCHTIQGTGAAGINGPDLTHLASRRALAAGTIPNTRGHLTGWIVDPQSIKPGNHMPPNVLAADELQDLVTYLGSLQ